MTKQELDDLIAQTKTHEDPAFHILATMMGELMLQVFRHSTEVKNKQATLTKQIEKLEEQMKTLCSQLESPIYRAVLDYEDEEESTEPSSDGD